MRILVCGGRDYNDYDRLETELDRIVQMIPGDFSVTWVCGGARGADELAIWYAGRHKERIEIYQADWKHHGKAAGPIRNQLMLDTGIDLVVAFPGGNGTAHMMKIAHKAGVEIIEIEE